MRRRNRDTRRQRNFRASAKFSSGDASAKVRKKFRKFRKILDRSGARIGANFRTGNFRKIQKISEKKIFPKKFEKFSEDSGKTPEKFSGQSGRDPKNFRNSEKFRSAKLRSLDFSRKCQRQNSIKGDHRAF